jgi:hypothetical protein
MRLEATMAENRQLETQIEDMQKARTEHDDAVEADHRKAVKELKKQCKQQTLAVHHHYHQ